MESGCGMDTQRLVFCARTLLALCWYSVVAMRIASAVLGKTSRQSAKSVCARHKSLDLKDILL